MSLLNRFGSAGVIVVSLVLLAGTLWPLVGIGAAAVGSASNHASDGANLQQQSFEPDGVVMSIDLRPDGSADWSVRYRLDIRTENETAAFEDLRDDIRSNTSDYITSFRSRIHATVAEAENATGREMRVENFSVQTRTDSLSESGFVTYTFTWHGFAETDGDQLRAGDALAGLFLDEQTTLTMTWPDEYELSSVQPSPTQSGDRSVSWAGRQSFGVDEPRLVVGPSSSGFTTWLPAIAVGIILLGIGMYLALRHRIGPTDGERSESPSSDAEPEGSPTGGETEGTDEDDGPPPELLSNEERVLQFLDQQGGRVKQQEVVSALDWTEAKTSQVVTEMRESGDIEVFRIGRENVIKLPDADLEGDGQDGSEDADDAAEADDR